MMARGCFFLILDQPLMFSYQSLLVGAIPGIGGLMYEIILVLTLLAGCLMPVQPAMNAIVAQWTNSAFFAAFLSFFVGTVALGLVCQILPNSWPARPALLQIPWWCWTAGILGAFFVTMTLVAIPRLGALTTIALLVAGQMFISLIMDHYGWFGIPVQVASPGRMLGALFLVVGVLCIQKF